MPRLPVLGFVLLIAGLGGAAQAATVHFEINQQTQFGQSVYLTGDAPALGDGDITHALKLSPTSYPDWFVDVELPPGEEVTHRFILRDDNPSDVGDPANFTLISQTDLTVTPPGAVMPPRSGMLRYLSTAAAPVLEIRESGGSHRQVPFMREGDGRTAGESLWRTDLTGLPPRGDWEFRIDLGGGSFETPSYGAHYLTSLTTAFLQDGHIFDFQPDPTVSPSQTFRIPDFQGSLPSRTLYIYLPRGYAEHTARRYPVLYMHDGRNVFASLPDGAFGQWNADTTADLLIQQGRMREAIIVGVDHGTDRIQEYLPPYSSFGGQPGRADQTAAHYQNDVKPFIDATYRTMTGRGDTAVCGSSLGGLFSTYLGWHVPEFARHAAGVSSSFSLFPEIVDDHLGVDPPPDIRLWLDSGTAGASADGMWATYGARDALLSNGLALGSDFRHYLDIGGIHSESSWAGRLDRIFLFLLPIAQGEVPQGVTLH